MKEKELVTQAERRWIADNAVMEIGEKTGRGVIYKVMDIDKVVDAIRKKRKDYSLSPYVEIMPISADMHKTPNRMATFQKDPLTGVLYGIVIGQDDFGNPKWQKIQWSDHLSLNLDNENEARIWAVIRFHPDIKGSPFQNDKPNFYIYDPVDSARAEVMRAEMMSKAFERVNILASKPSQMVMFGRYIGEVTGEEIRDNANYEIVKGLLLRFATNYPEEFNKRWDNKDRSFAERFHSAMALGIITDDANTGYMFRNIPLGLTPEETIKTLKKDNNILLAINAEIDENDLATKTVVNTYETAQRAGRAEKKDNKVLKKDDGKGGGKKGNDGFSDLDE